MNTTVPTREQLISAGWERLPLAYRMPAIRTTIEEAQAYCKELAESHYENFHVATWFLPKRLRPHFHSIYAYCRIADDLGDEVGNTEQSLALLDLWESELDACYAGHAIHPVFIALAETIGSCQIPKEPFADLLVAFRQDQTVTRYESMRDVLAYCRFSANPVGRLVLYACGYRSDELFRLSDLTCSGLQLANFWQDVAEDLERGRIYFPQEDLRRFGVTEAMLCEGAATQQFRALMSFEVEYARKMLMEGATLHSMVDRELAVDLRLFSDGGLAILDAIASRHYNVLTERPVVSKSRKIGMLLRALIGKTLVTLGGGNAGAVPTT